MRVLWKYFFLGMLLSAIPFGSWAYISTRADPEILGSEEELAATTQTPSALPTPTPTPTPSPKLTLAPTPSPKPKVIPIAPASSQQINAFIERFAAQYGVDPNVLRHIAICESGFNPLASNLSYAGLYQFSPNSWQNYRVKMGEEMNADLRFNAEEAVQTAAFVLSRNQGYIWPSCVP